MTPLNSYLLQLPVIVPLPLEQFLDVFAAQAPFLNLALVALDAKTLGPLAHLINLLSAFPIAGKRGEFVLDFLQRPIRCLTSFPQVKHRNP